MRPIALYIDGLHSFRSPASIDLDTLAAHGLFGVFGPTGSGKSTLLDAITLALFGTIDRRSGRGKKGLINLHRDDCEVRFRFRLEGVVWEAQRAYRRQRNGETKQHGSRLVRIDPDGEATVADQVREMNAAVERLLGLNAADFMRAVVLPQGRFMRFLHEEGQARRTILERLFRLERFGKALQDTIKRERSRVEVRLGEVTGELAGMGDASAQQLRRLRADLERARAERESAHEEAERADAKHRDAVRAHEHHRRLRQLREALERDRASYANAQVELQAVTRALKVRPSLQFARMRDAAEERLAEARRHYERAKDRRNTTVTSLERAQRQLEAEQHRDPPLDTIRSRIEALDTVKTLHERASTLEQQIGEIDGRLKVIQTKSSTIQRAICTAETELEALQCDQERDRRAHAAAAVEEDERRALREAIAAAQLLEQTRAEIARYRDQLARQQQQCSEILEAMEQHRRCAREATAEQVRWTRRLRDLQRQQEVLEPLGTALDAVRRNVLPELRSCLAHLDERLQALEQARAHHRKARLAAEGLDPHTLDPGRLAGILARDLEGPCPVCGSEEHPAPASPVEPHALWTDLEPWIDALATVRSAAERERAIHAEVEHTRMRCEQLRSTIPAWLGPYEELDGMLRRLDTARNALEHAMDAATQRCHEAERTAREASEQYERRRLLVEQVEARVSTIAQQIEDAEARAAAHAARSAALLAGQTLETLQRGIEERDRERNRLEQRMSRRSQDIAALQRTLRTHDEAYRRVNEAHQQECERRATLVAKLQPIQEELANHPTREEAREQLDDLREQLRRRQADLDAAERAHREANAAFMEADKAVTRAEADLRAAERDVERARRELEKALRRSGLEQLPNPDEALPGVDLEQRARSLDAILRDWDARTLELKRLEAEDHPLVDAPTLEQLARAREEARLRATRAESAWSMAAEELRRVEARAERYAELMEERASLLSRATHIDTLTRLCRGRALVRYIADDHLRQLTRRATEHLLALTRDRYSLELDEDGNFSVLDHDFGSTPRPVRTLSGGETFLASLALALALSTHIQEQRGSSLSFFFLDEGFATLDPEALDRVMGAMERLAGHASLVIGLISHLEAVRERVPTHLLLRCPRDGSGTRIVSKGA